jgi:hypothetical protein
MELVQPILTRWNAILTRWNAILTRWNDMLRVLERPSPPQSWQSPHLERHSPPQSPLILAQLTNSLRKYDLRQNQGARTVVMIDQLLANQHKHPESPDEASPHPP